MLGNIAKAWFGNFTADELKKFIKLGVIFSLVIGVYWTLRPLKDSIFQSMAHQDNQPWAKLLSLVVLFPLVILYSKIVDKVSRHKLFYVLGTLYAVGIFIMGLLFLHPTIGLANTHVDPSRILAWVWYVFVESYGSLVVALFWAIAADTTSPDAAKRGFPFVVMFGQIGSILGPLELIPLSKYFGNSAPVVLICGGLVILMMAAMAYFMATTPREQLAGYSGVVSPEQTKHEAEPGFFEGLKLLVSQKYLLGIFAVIGFFEIITTIIDFNFKCKVAATFALEQERACYLGDYAVWVNIVAFLSLLFGVSNIQRRLGIRVSLVLMPFIVFAMVLSFWFAPNVQTLFWIMVAAKAMNYALNGPALKQLYIPTTKETKYKVQAWIEAFGSRGSKATGSGFNLLKKPFQGAFGVAAGEAYMIALGAYLAFGLIAAWLLVALYLGKTYDKAVQENKVVC
jgi:ATP:ADP antiporter, AAA family